MLALILDRTHNVLVAAHGLPAVDLVDQRPLQTLQRGFAARGLVLGAPAGSRVSDIGGRDFAFVIDPVPAPEGLAWRALREVSDDDELWGLYVSLLLAGYTPPTRTVDVWSFGDRPEMASQLLHLVTCGAKRATMAWVDAAKQDHTPLAYLGGVSVVTDGFGYPRAVLRSTEVRVVRFDEVEPAWAAAEAEGDLTYDDWREGHEAYFARDALRLGLTFDASAAISVEHFEVLQVVGRGDH